MFLADSYAVAIRAISAGHEAPPSLCVTGTSLWSASHRLLTSLAAPVGAVGATALYPVAERVPITQALRWRTSRRWSRGGVEARHHARFPCARTRREASGGAVLSASSRAVLVTTRKTGGRNGMEHGSGFGYDAECRKAAARSAVERLRRCRLIPANDADADAVNCVL